MHEGKYLSQLDKGKFTLLETLYNDDKWRHREHFWSTLSDCTSSYIEVIMFSFLFPDSNRLYSGQHTSFTFLLNVFDIVWHTALKKSSWALLLIPSWISLLHITGLNKHTHGMVTILSAWGKKEKKKKVRFHVSHQKVYQHHIKYNSYAQSASSPVPLPMAPAIPGRLLCSVPPRTAPFK